MKLGFSTLGCPTWTLERIAEFAGAHGFDGVELRTHADGNHFAESASIAEAKEVRSLFEANGTRVFSLMAYTRFSSTDARDLEQNRDKLLHVLDLALAAGASYVRTFAGVFTGQKSRDRAVAEAAPYMAPCAAKAREIGVSLGVETHDDWCDAANIRALQKAVGGGLGAVWDFTNAFFATGKGPEQQYAELGDTILYCHVKDAVKESDGKVRYVPVGTGNVPVRRLIELLRKNEPDVFLSFEHEKKWHPELPEPEEAFPGYLGFMRSLIG